MNQLWVVFHCWWFLMCTTTAVVLCNCAAPFLFFFFCALSSHLLLKELMFPSSAPPVTTTLQAVAWRCSAIKHLPALTSHTQDPPATSLRWTRDCFKLQKHGENFFPFYVKVPLMKHFAWFMRKINVSEGHCVVQWCVIVFLIFFSLSSRGFLF